MDVASVSIENHLIFEIDIQSSGKMNAKLNYLPKGNSDFWLLLVLNMGDASITFSRKNTDQRLVNLLTFGRKEDIKQVVQYPRLSLKKESLHPIGICFGVFVCLFLRLILVLLKLNIEGIENSLGSQIFVIDIFLAFLLEFVDIIGSHDLVGSINVLLLQQLFLQFDPLLHGLDFLLKLFLGVFLECQV